MLRYPDDGSEECRSLISSLLTFKHLVSDVELHGGYIVGRCSSVEIRSNKSDDSFCKTDFHRRQ
jgi:hypothetical protein